MSLPHRAFVATPSGRIAYQETGAGPVALFVHGVLLNSSLWRHQLAGLADIRRCIALDLMAHGDTEIAPDQDVSVTANAHMILEFLDAMGLDQVDLVGNDSGGGIAQIFAALYPERVRSLALTNTDTHDNWPPQAFLGFVEMVAQGGLKDTLTAMLADKAVFRSAQALGLCYEDPDLVADATIETYLRPHLASPQRLHDLERFVGAWDNAHTVAIEPRLRELEAPTLIVWGDDDIYFDVQWGRWLKDAIPGATRLVELKGARLFFPEERPGPFNQDLRTFWQGA